MVGLSGWALVPNMRRTKTRRGQKVYNGDFYSSCNALEKFQQFHVTVKLTGECIKPQNKRFTKYFRVLLS